MSIIWGRYNYRGKSILNKHTSELNRTFQHIQPDKSESWNNQCCQLACLLKYNSLESLKEHLPFNDKTTQLTITADCRIDNRKELICKLQIADKNIPDSLLILSAYKKWGKSCVKHLVGAFSFAIWNERKKELFCARDQIGVRPFFYIHNNVFFAFSSEVKGLLSIEDLDKSINKDYIINYVAWFVQKETDTSYKNIHRLPPAHTLSISPNDIKIERYWDLDINQVIKYRKEEDYLAHFKEKMHEAVKCRLRNPREIGIELSGGLDSSGIAAIAQKHLPKENKLLHSFELLLPDEHRGKTWPYDDNKKFIDEVCQKSNIVNRHPIYSMGDISVVENLDLRLKIYDGITEFNTYSHSGIMKETAAPFNVGVMLSGFGGQELPTSYGRHAHLEYLERHNWYRYFKIGNLPASEDYPSFGNKHLIKTFLFFYLQKINSPLAQGLYDMVRKGNNLGKENKVTKVGNFLMPHLKTKYQRTYKKGSKKTYPATSFRNTQKQFTLRPITAARVEAENITGNFFGGMEVRYPLLDIRLLEYVLAIPAEQKRNQKYGRLIYRRCLDDLLPKSITWRNEEGPGGTLPFSRLEFNKHLEGNTQFLEWMHKNNAFFPFVNTQKILDQFYHSIDIFSGKRPFEFTANNRIAALMILARYFYVNNEELV